MTTAAEMRVKRAAKAQSNGKPAVGNVGEALPVRSERIELRPASLAVDAIEPNPWQPRQDFPAAEIRTLADTIAVQGQLQPIVVRPVPGKPDRYQVGDGERRLRAVKLIGWTEIRAEVGAFSDAEMAEMALVTAVHRKDLNEIEKAIAVQAMLAGDATLTQGRLAERLGMEQGTLSNLLRLLKLPAAWRKRVISQEIPPTHARSLVRYAEHPAILAEVEKAIADEKRYGESDGIGTVEHFEETVNDAADNATRPVDPKGSIYSSKLAKSIPIFTPTPEQREELGIIEIPAKRGIAALRETVAAATNVKLWERLQAEHEQRLIAAAEKKGSTKKMQARKEKPPTPAEQKWFAAEEARKAEEHAEQFARRLYEWKEGWMRWLIAEHLRTVCDLPAIARVLMLGLCEFGCMHRAGFDVGKALGSGRRTHAVHDLFTVEDFELDKIGGRLAAQMFYDRSQGPLKVVFAKNLEDLCGGLEIDFDLEWSNHQAGPLSEAYWRLHTKDQLIALAAEVTAGFSAEILRGTKEQLVAAFLAQIPAEDDKDAGLPMPKEIRKRKFPR